MPKRENYNDLYAFLLVANEKNFSRAASKLGVSSPALKQNNSFIRRTARFATIC
ncbi:LysR family transcriptional regulator [Mannheimia sp. HC-2023]|uniref:helix-turn-helix domain-containing protein n=1 Tax=Mannheimia indoligenes TaxID=3103145 RepID=UPI002FE68113